MSSSIKAHLAVVGTLLTAVGFIGLLIAYPILIVILLGLGIAVVLVEMYRSIYRDFKDGFSD